MNHCVLEVEVIQAPTVRYTQENQMPIAEMEVRFDALRPNDLPGELKVVGWGNLSQDLQDHVQVGQHLVLEGRLRMNTVTRRDGTKAKSGELTLSRFHSIGPRSGTSNSDPYMTDVPSGVTKAKMMLGGHKSLQPETAAEWNSSPLVPNTDDIPF